ncbi:MAG: hypothetical protein H0U69_04235 [Trueperaceae bacterium]|nr:hypothetical protein [Trueperaceae bacterium]
MFFRRKRRADGTAIGRWHEFAERLELRDASDVAERIRRWLDLGDAELSPVYLLQRTDMPAIYLYDSRTSRHGPTGSVRALRRSVLVRSDDPISHVAFRAWPRQNAVLESLEASRSGAVRVDVADDPVFDAAVSVFARDVRAPLRALRPHVREVLARLLVERGAPSIRIVVGERHLVTTFDAADGDALTTLEEVLADTLALTALLPSAGGAATPAGGGSPAGDVPIAPDDRPELH